MVAGDCLGAILFAAKNTECSCFNPVTPGQLSSSCGLCELFSAQGLT